jgi:hypothetical protein
MYRREFLQIASLVPAALLDPEFVRAKESFQPTVPGFAAFRPLEAGAVSPDGWLRLYLTKQAAQLGGHLSEVSSPFDGKYWAGEEKTPDGSKDGWWPWEQKAYWIDGTTRCALVLEDQNLLNLSLQAIDYTLRHANPDGYLGPSFARFPEGKDKVDGILRWPHTVFFRALTAYADSKRDGSVAAAIRRHYLADENRVIYGTSGRDVTNVEGMLWVYGQTGDRRMLAMAEKAWSEFLRSVPPGDIESGDLHPDRVFADAPITSHGVTYVEKAKLPAILYLYTGRAEYLRYALAAQQRIFDHHMLIDGIPSASEHYRGTTALDAHETCDITDHMWSWGYLLQATGDGVWGDRIERACFNAGFGAIKKDWSAVQYFSCPNQVIATHNSSHVPYIEDSIGWMAFAPNPGHATACCGGNVHRFFPNYVIGMWMADSGGGLAAVLYGASTVQAQVGPNQDSIRIRQETDYPFGEEIHFSLELPKPIAFPLSFRVPAWCEAPRLALNGESVALPPIRKGFITLSRTFSPGDRVTLALPMHKTTTAWPNQGVGIEHGPLVYTLAVKAKWQPTALPPWSTLKYPDWDATATSAWNYAWASKPGDLASQAKLERRPMTKDPWLEPPVVLTVPMKSVSGWTLHAPDAHPDRLQTPPLPEHVSLERAQTTPLALVPYGSTHLRLTIFPSA